MSGASKIWRLWIDTGGTFTDCLAVDPDGVIHRAKVLSSGSLRGRVRPSDDASCVRWSSGSGRAPEGFFAGCQLRTLGGSGESIEIIDSTASGELVLDTGWTHGEVDVEVGFDEEAAIVAARLVTGTAAGCDLPEVDVRFATTRGTNALLERRGTPPVLFVTRGFRDLLAIGNQQRPDLFAIRVEKPDPLYAEVIEVEERLSANGMVVREFDLEGTAEAARDAVRRGHVVAAVALLHSYRNSAHEQRLANLLREVGFSHVSVSSELSSRVKIVPRAETAVVDAYLATVVGQYLSNVADGLGSRTFHVMTSAGGLVRDSSYRAKDSLLSGPAGGVVGAVAAGRMSGAARLLAFDMGGTSTDVTRHDGDFEYRSETIVGGARLSSASLAVETVAAGGGSICTFNGRQLKVGPESSGADPGPACYGKGGPLTLTDVNLLLGRLIGERFPFTVDVVAAEERARKIVSEHRAASDVGMDTAELLFGFLRIANEKMAGAVRAISLRAGYRPADYALLTFGGAGPQHACALADLLGVGRVLIPNDAALLSAFGLGHAHLERIAEQQVLENLDTAAESLEDRFVDLERQAISMLASEGVPGAQALVRRREVFLRYSGQEATLDIEWGPNIDIGAAFGDAYEVHFGYQPEGREIEVESLRLIASDLGAGVDPVPSPPREGLAARVADRRAMFSTVGWVEADVIERRSLGLSNTIVGPALLVEEHTATVVEPGWKGALDSRGGLLLEKV